MNFCVQSVVKDSNCVPVTGQDCFVIGNVETRTKLPVYYPVVTHVPFAGWLPQKKGVIPEHQMPIKSVKGVSCVNQLSSVQNVINVPLVVPNLPVGARLHQFWEKWAVLGVSPKVLAVLREGYILPFQSRPNLTRSPIITSCYINPQRNSYLLEALHQLLNKNAIELVQNPQSLGFYNQLFLVPKPNNQWHPILDLSNLNKFLKTQSFKMETPETIRTFEDNLGNVPINVNKDENLTRLLDSFYRDRPKGRRGIPSWNLSLVLHQLTKAPFEPLKEASLKDCFPTSPGFG